jgi:hypothetical protein
MHDGIFWPTSVTTGDTWLKANLDSYIQWAKTNNSLLIITWDEDNDDVTNHIATIFIGSMVKHGQYDEASLKNSMAAQAGMDHTNVLRTIEDMYALPHSAQAGNLNTGTANVDPITDCWLSSVPIKLISFKALAADEGVNLSWTTASEINNDYFTIENSANGIDFHEVGTVKGAGTTQELHSYSYLHKNPSTGKSFYRLRQTDFDRKNSYSNITKVEIEKRHSASFEVYPNPSDGESFQLLLKNFNSSTLNICIYDLCGQRVETQLNSITEAEDSKIYFRTNQKLPPGIYLLNVSDSQSHVTRKMEVR